MDAARKHVRRFQQLASQNLGRAEKTEVVTDDLHNVEQRVEHMIDALHHTKQKLTECLRSRSSQDNPDKRRKKLVEYHFAQSLLNDSKNLEDVLKDSLLSQILSIYGNGMLNVVEELVQSEFNVEKRIFEHLSKYSEENKGVAATKEKMKKAILDMDSAKSRLLNATNRGEKSDHLQEENDVCWNKVESCKDNWALELYTLAGKEIDMANIFLILVKLQMDYYRTAYTTLEGLLPLIQIKIDQYPGRPVYGCPLADHLRYSNREIAVVLEVCCAALCELGLREEGLFRISGTSPKIRKLKASFDIDEIDLNDFENHPHSIAGALKMYLRELPDPLMTHNLYGDWIRAVGCDDTETRLKAIREVVAKMPSANHANLRYLIKFLSKVCENQQYTKMNSQSLAIVLAPNMLWSPNNDEGFGSNSSLATLVDCLISNADYFFPGEIKFTSNRIGSLINKTGGFIDTDSNFIQQRAAQPPDHNRSRSPTPSVDTLASGQWNPAKGQPVRRPKPPAPPPPSKYSHQASAPLNLSVMNSSSGEDYTVEDPEYAVVPDDDADGDDEDNVDLKDPLYSVPNKQHHSMHSAQTPPDDPVVVLQSMSSSMIRTPPTAVATEDVPKKSHRKTNSLDRPARPPRISMMEGVTGSTNSLERPLLNTKTSKTPPTSVDNHQTSDDDKRQPSDEDRRQPSRPPLPSKDHVHPTVTSRHSINLKFSGGGPPARPSPPPSLPVINSTYHGATTVEVEPPDDADDADMDYDGSSSGRWTQNNEPRQAPIVAFRRNMFEKNNENYQQTVNGDVSTPSSRSSTKKKTPSVQEEKSPTSTNGAPSRPKPPVPSKPRTSGEIASGEIVIDHNMTRL